MRKFFWILVFSFLMVSGGALMSQPLPGQNGDGSSLGGDPIGGGANIGGGVTILLVLATGYGLKKAYDNRRRLEE